MTFNKREYELSKPPSFCAVTADPKSRWPHGIKSCYRGVGSDRPKNRDGSTSPQDQLFGRWNCWGDGPPTRKTAATTGVCRDERQSNIRHQTGKRGQTYSMCKTLTADDGENNETTTTRWWWWWQWWWWMAVMMMMMMMMMMTMVVMNGGDDDDDDDDDDGDEWRWWWWWWWWWWQWWWWMAVMVKGDDDDGGGGGDERWWRRRRWWCNGEVLMATMVVMWGRGGLTWLFAWPTPSGTGRAAARPAPPDTNSSPEAPATTGKRENREIRREPLCSGFWELWD